MSDDEALAGGNVGGPVVRIGDTVRKPWTAATASVVDFVQALRRAGVDLPEPRGRDAQGRQVQEFVPGVLAIDAPPLDGAGLRRVGAMVRRIHDASASYTPPADAVWDSAIAAPGAELVCHNDLAPWNLIVGERWVFIDADAAAPSTRLWDLAYAAQAFTLNDPGRDPTAAAADLAAFAEGYGADAVMRRLLPDALARRTVAMRDLLRAAAETGREPWATMSREGHGEHWRGAAGYVTAHRGVWATALSTPSAPAGSVITPTTS